MCAPSSRHSGIILKRCPLDSADFRKLVRDALEHIHDISYLELHPLLSWLAPPASPVQGTRGQRLRAILKDKIEDLRPQPSSPANTPEWRSYLALRYRYIQAMSMAEIENRLGISLRQLQRELHKGLDALTSLLWDQRATAQAVVAGESLSPTLQELQAELDQWQLDRQVTSLPGLMNDTFLLLQPLLEQRAIALAIDYPPDLSPVLVDATLLRQALFKALRLMAQNASGPIAIQAIQREMQIDLLFNCTPCASPAHKEEWQMVELLISHQGGKLAVENQSAGGSLVTLSLPRASQIRVLVIDDNPAIHQLFERYLALHHYKVIHTRNAADALQAAVEALPDLIILDVMMPGVDGWQVLRDLAHNPATSRIPVIICSVLNEPELAFSLGAQAYLKKPVDRLELLATLARLHHPAGPASELH